MEDVTEKEYETIIYKVSHGIELNIREEQIFKNIIYKKIAPCHNGGMH